ncbi:Protein of unknown function [Micrococcales bacterium KH10]|nr:Protein of unknown function [Micrococcales bacterium KH10]
MSDDQRSDAVTPGISETVIELSLVGLHPDGEHLILRAAGNTRFVVPIDEKLAAAVRGDRSRLEYLQSASSLSPRDIQARVRAGESAESIARDSGMPVTQIQRLERPVLDERAFIAKQARRARVGSSPDAPELGDLVTDRLAAREVEVADLQWDATKRSSSSWQVSVTFTVGTKTTSARWSYDPRNQILKAIEDEARWLSETELADEPIPNRRHLSAVHDTPFDIESSEAHATSARELPESTVPDRSVAPVVPLTPTSQIPAVDTEALLDDLAARRGTRQGYDPDSSDEGTIADSLADPATADTSETDEDEASSARVYSLQRADIADPAPDSGGGSAENAETAPSLFELPESIPVPRQATARPADIEAPPAQSPESSATAQTTAPDDEVPPPPAPRTKSARSSRKSRSQMPSWDEIVFGAKPE